MSDQATSNLNQTTQKRNPLLAVVLVLLVLTTAFGASLRFLSVNWDDFASLHPDERFLTRNLLPLIGGGLEFTPNPDDFPPHEMVVRSDSALQSLLDVQTNPALQIGSVDGTLAGDLAGWLTDAQRVQLYPNATEAMNALSAGVVQAVLLDQSLAQLQLLNRPEAVAVGQLASEDVQRTRCRAYNPDTNGVGGYFDTDCSALNPHNAGTGAYAYGTLPLFMSHGISEFLRGQDAQGLIEFQGGTLVWRTLSALFDTLTIVVIFAIGMRMHNKWVGLFAAILYAAAPLAIQKAHFGTVNSITAFFVTLALWAAVCVQDRGRYWHFVIFGLALGAALAGRINVIPLAGVVVLAAMVYAAPALDRRLPWQTREPLLWRAILGVIIAGVSTVVAFRLFNPYAFDGPSILGIIPNDRWLGDATSSSFNVSGASDIPPNWQWLARTGYFYPLKDMLLWGMGIAMGLLAWVGFGWSAYRIARGKAFSLRNILLVAWVGVYFAWIGGIWVMTMRYYLPLYSSLALLAGWAIYALWRQAQEQHGEVLLTRLLLGTFTITLGAIPLYLLNSGQAMTATGLVAGGVSLVLAAATFVPRLGGKRAIVLGGFALSFTVLWGLMYSNIYQQQSTRVQASRWVWENVSGDFSMEIEGAPEGTPLINLAVFNRNGNSANSPEELPSYVTRYEVGAPQFVEFTAPATGTVSSIHAPHLDDPINDPDPEILYISIAQQDDNGVPQLVAEVTFEAELSGSDHIIGDRYDLVFPEAFAVEAGQRYQVKIEAMTGGGPITSAGEVMLTEGTWDDRITTTMICRLPDGISLMDNPVPGLATFDSCNGLLSNQALLQSYDLPMSYPVDEALKRDAILRGLEVGDYLAITSNRFYDTETRNPARWPMTTEYYRALFAGELGYELEQVFSESYEFGPLSVDDQHLPIYDSPQWFNEFEADEAFHVYDHPTVFIFRKADDYDHYEVRRIIGSVPLTRTDQIIGPFEEIGDELANVVYWPSLEANEAPTALMQTAENQATNTEGGTWSERFDSDSLLNTNQVIGVAVWWLTLIALGLVAWPLLFTLFPTMGDRGYSFSKIVALLLLGWVAWFASTLHIQLWSQAGLLLLLVLLIALSGALAWRKREAMRDYLSEHWQRLLLIEALTTLLFVVFIGIRLTNPDMWHYPMGGERPMDFAYFNATLRSTVFPAYDPWHAGGFINYYYVGYVVVGVPVLLLKIVPAFAYNLIIPSIFAMTGIGAFSVAFNIVERWRRHRDNDTKVGTVRMGNPWLAGIAALLLCCVLGNLDTLRVLGHGIAQLGGYQRPTGLHGYLLERYQDENGIPADPTISFELQERAQAGYITDSIAYEIDNVVDLVSSLGRGIGPMLQGVPLPIGYNRWYWAPTRVLGETPGVEGNAITEMPYFTFVYGDLHAHMINMPIMLFALLFVFNEVVLARRDPRKTATVVLSLLVGGVAIGMMQAINTWDWPTFMVLGVVGLGYAWWLRWERIDRTSLLHLLAYVGGFLLLARFAVLPYSSYYASVYNSVQLWEGGKTPLWAYLDIHGLFIFLIAALFVWDTGRWLRSTRMSTLRGQRNGVLIAAGITMIVLVASLGTALFDYQAALIVVPLLLWIVALFFRDGQSIEMQFVLVLIGLALALTLAVEIVVLGGDIGRQNTVFKFYIQVWLLLSVAGGAGFAWVVQRSHEWSTRTNALFFVPLVVLVTIAAAFPLMSTRARSLDRLAPDTPLTLNGHDYMQYAELTLFDVLVTIPLDSDYQIIRWLQENVEGTPTIMEGRSTTWSEYHYNGRIAINTGLPNVLGWKFHQKQQRTLNPLPNLVEQRERNVRYFYDSADLIGSVNILQHYDVRYVILSDMELAQITQQGREKIRQMEALSLLTPAEAFGDAVIYDVNQDTLDKFLRDQLVMTDLMPIGDDNALLPRTNVDPVEQETILRTLAQYKITFFVADNIRAITPPPDRPDPLVALRDAGLIEAIYINESVNQAVYRVDLRTIAERLNNED